MATDPLFQRGGIGLNPAEQGGMVDANAAIRQHESEITVANREGQIPTQCPQDDLGREVPPPERPVLFGRHCRPPDAASRSPGPSTCSRTSATEPYCVPCDGLIRLFPARGITT